MPKKITITDTGGTAVEITVSDDDTAREFEGLPFETEHIVSVTVSDD